MSPSNVTRSHPRSRSASALVLVLVLGVGGSAWLGASGTAAAAVPGRHGGVEIEGAQDRRGFYIGGGLGLGGTFFNSKDFIPATRIDLGLGGGVTRKLTLGVDLHVTPYLARNVGVGFGADIEGTGFIGRGFYVRLGLGVAAVPPRREDRREGSRRPEMGVGGAAGVGYEFFLNASAAMSAGLTYDARIVPGESFPRQTALVGLRFVWY